MVTYRTFTSHETQIYHDSLQIRNELLRLPIGKNIFDEDLSIEKENLFFGAFDGEKIIGMLSFYQSKPKTAHLTTFAAKESYQHRGIGSQLVQALINYLRDASYAEIQVDAREEAVLFYQKCHFNVLEGPITNPHLNVIDFKMAYSLEVSYSETIFHCSCLCTEIEYDVSLANLNLGICHCSMCRKNTGGTGFSFFYSLEKPTFTKQSSLTLFNANGTAERAFCNQCGSTVYYHHLSDGGYCIPSGVIDDLDESNVTFGKEWCLTDKPNYYSYHK